MLLPSVLLPALSLVITEVISESDEFPCPNVLPIHSTTISASESSCRKEEQLLVSSRRIKRQAGRATLGRCGNELLSQIMQNVLGQLLPRNMRLGDTAQVLQKAVQAATGQSHEVLMGKGDMVVASHQMSESSHCKLRVGEYYVTVYETPIGAGGGGYDVNDVAKEQELSNIDFGEKNGGSGFPGQAPFPHQPPIEILLNNLVASTGLSPGGVNGLFAAGGGAGACFSGDMIVETIDGPKQMRELKTGDEVLSIDDNSISFSPIIMFLHREEEKVAQFNVITTINGETIKLTNDHLIYVCDCDDPSTHLRLLRAKEVTTDHCLMTVQSHNRIQAIHRVSNITKSFEVGIYAPLTSTGDIIVNDVLSSCYCTVASKTLQQTLFSFYRFLYFILPEKGYLPLGLEFLTRAIDLFVPIKETFGKL